MIRPRIIVCLDVDHGRVVKGTKFKGLRDVGDPVELAERYENRPGGYTRVLKTRNRVGDAAALSIVELVEAMPEAKPAGKQAGAKKATTRKATSKKATAKKATSKKVAKKSD